MGRAAAAPAAAACQAAAIWARRRSDAGCGRQTFQILLLALLLSLGLPAAEGARGANCPTYCVCNVTIQVFYLVTCTRASLDDVPRELPSKAFTTMLDLSNNQLTKLRENALDDFAQLHQITLNDNSIKEIHRLAFARNLQLRSVFLARNQLASLPPELFERNANLQLLDLSSNELSIPPSGPFLRSRSLLILNLSEAHINHVPPKALMSLPALQRLDLRRNMLRSVDLAAVSFLRNFTLLLRGNPLRCDCALRRTWHWHMTQAQSLAAQEEPALCVDPAPFKDTPLNAMAEQLECDGATAAHAVTSAGTYALYGAVGLLAVGVVAGVATAVTVARRRRQRQARAGGPPVGAWRRPKRFAPPVGEYIEVLPDAVNPNMTKTMEKPEAVYEVVGERKLTEGDGKGKGNSEGGNGVALRTGGDDDSQRYVTDMTRCTYLPPSVPPRVESEEPLYVNMKGPPLPQRLCSDAPPLPQTQPPQQLPTLQQPPRPCSVPLLEGCDFYEVVD